MRKSKDFLFDAAIRNVPFFACLQADEMKELSQSLVEKFFPRNKIIFLEEDTQNYMYVVLSGKVKAVHMTEDGKEHILAVHKTGDFFGEMALLDGKTAPATVIAMEDARILILSKKDFDKYLIKNDRVLREVVSVLCSRLRDAWIMHKVLGLTRVEDRIRTLLKLMSMRYGVKSPEGTVLATKLTHQDLADYASVSRETVTRFLNKLEKKGEIEILDDKRLMLKPSFR